MLTSVDLFLPRLKCKSSMSRTKLEFSTTSEHRWVAKMTPKWTWVCCNAKTNSTFDFNKRQLKLIQSKHSRSEIFLGFFVEVFNAKIDLFDDGENVCVTGARIVWMRQQHANLFQQFDRENSRCYGVCTESCDVAWCARSEQKYDFFFSPFIHCSPWQNIVCDQRSLSPWMLSHHRRHWTQHLFFIVARWSWNSKKKAKQNKRQNKRFADAKNLMKCVRPSSVYDVESVKHISHDVKHLSAMQTYNKTVKPLRVSANRMSTVDTTLNQCRSEKRPNQLNAVRVI